MRAEAEYNPNDFTSQGMSEADKTLLVKFFIASRPDKKASEVEGRPIFKDVEMIDIRTPGNRTDYIIKVADRNDIQRFSEHYRMFKARTESGTEE